MAAEHGGGGGMPDPIHQFEIKRLFPLEILGIDATFTNSALFMVLAVGLVVGLLMFSSSARALVPSRLQSVAESLYEFIANMVKLQYQGPSARSEVDHRQGELGIGKGELNGKNFVVKYLVVDLGKKRIRTAN